jgi:hypothetical protein
MAVIKARILESFSYHYFSAKEKKKLVDGYDNIS